MVDPPYRVAAPATHDPYLAAWAVLKRRRVIARVASVGAVGLVAPTVAVAFTSGAAQEVAPAVVVSWVAVGVILFWLSASHLLVPRLRDRILSELDRASRVLEPMRRVRHRDRHGEGRERT